MKPDERAKGVKPKPSILTVLALIQRRPAMYLGWDDHTRREQLHALGSVLTGYSLALRQHATGKDDLDLLGALEEYLRERSGAGNLNAIDQILATSETDREAWNRIWALIDEFRERVGHTF